MAALRRLVLQDRVLQQRLIGLGDRATFSAAAAEVARQRGLDLGPADVVAAIDQARRQWWERWV
jgi:hypothetical protein